MMRRDFVLKFELNKEAFITNFAAVQYAIADVFGEYFHIPPSSFSTEWKASYDTSTHNQKQNPSLEDLGGQVPFQNQSVNYFRQQQASSSSSSHSPHSNFRRSLSGQYVHPASGNSDPSGELGGDGVPPAIPRSRYFQASISMNCLSQNLDEILNSDSADINPRKSCLSKLQLQKKSQSLEKHSKNSNNKQKQQPFGGLDSDGLGAPGEACTAYQKADQCTRSLYGWNKYASLWTCNELENAIRKASSPICMNKNSQFWKSLSDAIDDALLVGPGTTISSIQFHNFACEVNKCPVNTPICRKSGACDKCKNDRDCEIAANYNATAAALAGRNDGGPSCDLRTGTCKGGEALAAMFPLTPAPTAAASATATVVYKKCNRFPNGTLYNCIQVGLLILNNQFSKQFTNLHFIFFSLNYLILFARKYPRGLCMFYSINGVDIFGSTNGARKI